MLIHPHQLPEVAAGLLALAGRLKGDDHLLSAVMIEQAARQLTGATVVMNSELASSGGLGDRAA